MTKLDTEKYGKERHGGSLKKNGYRALQKVLISREMYRRTVIEANHTEIKTIELQPPP